MYKIVHTYIPHCIPCISSTASPQRCQLPGQRRRRPRWARRSGALIWPRCTLLMPGNWDITGIIIYKWDNHGKSWKIWDNIDVVKFMLI